MKPSRNVEEIIISPEKREEILNELRQVSKKWNVIKYLKYYTIHLYPSFWQKNGLK